MFDAIYLSRESEGTRAELRRLDDSMLLAGDVEVRVSYSSVNFKDALAITGQGAVVREWPMVPGVDLAGVIDRSEHPAWKRGEHVVVTGWGLGETHWGGLAQHARLPSNWLLRVPEGLSLRDSMIIGTAGFTAALCVMALRRHAVAPGDGEILVTGAAGGVGPVSFAGTLPSIRHALSFRPDSPSSIIAARYRPFGDTSMLNGNQAGSAS